MFSYYLQLAIVLSHLNEYEVSLVQLAVYVISRKVWLFHCSFRQRDFEVETVHLQFRICKVTARFTERFIRDVVIAK